MSDYFELLSAFLKTEFAKEHKLFIVTVLVSVVVITVAITSLVFKKFFYQNEINQLEKLKAENEQLSRNNRFLKNENEKIRKQLEKYEFEISIDSLNEDAPEDLALKKFTKAN